MLAYRLCKCPEDRRRRVVLTLCAVLLFGNLFRYCVVYPFVKGVVTLPVEFSTAAYFAVPTILLTSKKRLHSWAAYSGLMAGFFYYIAMIAAGGLIYGTNPLLDIYISMFCHGSIYFCGFVTIGTEECRAKEAPKLALGVALVAIRAASATPVCRGQQPASDLHSAGCCCCKADPSGKHLDSRSASLLSCGRGVRAADHPQLLPQESEAVPQIHRPAGSLKPNRDCGDRLCPCKYCSRFVNLCVSLT